MQGEVQPVWILLGCVLSVVGQEKPNIVFILADDMGRGDVGYLGSDIPTPNIDALAYSGVSLRRFYALPSCSPSRTALLTGRYPCRTGMQGMPLLAGSFAGLPLSEKLLPEYLKELGYANYMVGKWHLGYSTEAHLPMFRGFDSFYGYWNGYLGYYDGYHKFQNVSGLDARRNGRKVWEEFSGQYLPNVLAQEAVDIIKHHAANKAESPFFLYVAANAPHNGNVAFQLEPPEEMFERTANIRPQYRRIYADVVQYVDMTVANVTAALADHGYLENTIIVFVSDNGAPTADPVFHFNNYGSNYPFRGIKMSLHEGGVRTPAILWTYDISQRRMKPKERIFNGLFHMADWLPTLLSAVGYDMNQLKNRKLDGIDQWKSLTNMEKRKPRKSLLVDMQPTEKAEAVVSGRFKLIRDFATSNAFKYSDGYYGYKPEYTYRFNLVERSVVSRIIGGLSEMEMRRIRRLLRIPIRCSLYEQRAAVERDCSSRYCLFDLRNDPWECFDISRRRPEKVQELKKLLKAYQNEGVVDHQASTPRYPPTNFYWSTYKSDNYTTVSTTH